MIRKKRMGGSMSNRYRYMDCLVQGCSKSECGTTFDDFEVGALVLVVSIGSVGNQKWLYHGTRCQACIFDGNLKTKPYGSIFKRAVETYAEKINYNGEAQKLTVNVDPLDSAFDKYPGTFECFNPNGDVENLYKKVSR